MVRPPASDDPAGHAAVTVWWAWCSRSRPLDQAALSGVERARVDSLRLEADRERSALARVVLRLALADRLGEPAHAFEIDWANGPSLHPALGLWVSIAHSDDGVVVALSNVGPVGVDVEPLTRAQDLHREVRERVFTSGERDALDALSDDISSRAAVELWTVKEAVPKAAGGRFTHPPAQVEIERHGGPPQLVRFDDRRDLIERARLAVIAPPGGGVDDGYLGTVAVLGGVSDGPLAVVARDAAELLG